ncbi:hypothetical protein [uncultured Sphingomonas sp.]|uniref:hypothetical protein n=1 Tax=uncultured Sphingomonas sp. TaxID=158754 RepID=UPI0035CBDB00
MNQRGHRDRIAVPFFVLDDLTAALHPDARNRGGGRGRARPLHARRRLPQLRAGMDAIADAG